MTRLPYLYFTGNNKVVQACTCRNHLSRPMSKDLRRPNLPFRIPDALFTSRRATSIKKIELFLILWRVSRVSERGQKRQGKRIRCVALNFSHFCDDWTVTENPSIVDRCKPSIKDIDQCISWLCLLQMHWRTI